jgi:hypothetical protein
VWLQLVHLLLADLVWIALVAVGGLSLAPAGETAPVEPVLEPARTAHAR